MVFDSFKHSGRVCRCATSALLQETCIKFLQDLHQLEQLLELSEQVPDDHEVDGVAEYKLQKTLCRLYRLG